jgi:hypothetical protein
MFWTEFAEANKEMPARLGLKNAPTPDSFVGTELPGSAGAWVRRESFKGVSFCAIFSPYQ